MILISRRLIKIDMMMLGMFNRLKLKVIMFMMKVVIMIFGMEFDLLRMLILLSIIIVIIFSF